VLVRRVTWVTSCAILLAVVAQGAETAGGQLDGRVLLDREEISACMPVSGVIEIQPQQDTTVPGEKWAAFKYQRECLEVAIETPQDSVIVLDWAHLADGLHVDWAPLRGESMLKRGEIYVYPIFLLKTRSGFLFDTAGEYLITYRFKCIGDQPEFATTIRVVEGKEEEREAFVAAFSREDVIVEPFCNATIADSVGGIPAQSPYFGAWQIAQANQLVGELVGRKLFNADSLEIGTPAHRNWLVNGRNSDRVARGLQLDANLQKPRGIWRVLHLRQQALRGVQAGSWASPVDGEGRTVIMPF